MPVQSESSVPSESTGQSDSSVSPLSGRRQQAARNDAQILEAARQVFLAEPKAPISAVAERAGVGMSALYRRYPGKEELLRQLCQDGLKTFITEAEAASAEPDAWRALTGFLRRIVDADVHSLTVHLAGTFTPTRQMFTDAERAAALAAGLVDRARVSGQLRPDAGTGDVTLVLEACAAVRTPDHDRTRELRQRCLGVLLAGLEGPGTAPLPGPPPSPGELNWRWQQRPGG
jgi:AcrR family transcriptional regulator